VTPPVCVVTLYILDLGILVVVRGLDGDIRYMRESSVTGPIGIQDFLYLINKFYHRTEGMISKNAVFHGILRCSIV